MSSSDVLETSVPIAATRVRGLRNLRRAAILDKNLRLSAETLTSVRVSTPGRAAIQTEESFFL